MPTINVSIKDLNMLSAKEFTYEELESEAILLVKGEIEGVDGDDIIVDVKDSNRPDLWSTEGIARVLKSHYTDEKGIKEYKVEESDIYLHVDRTVDDVRPFIVAAVIEDVEITEDLLIQLIQIQEKVCLSFGRKRKRVALGIYDFDKIKSPLTYKAVKPESVKFIPLEYKVEMTLKEILETHPKGIEYKDLLKDFDKYPIVVDSKNNILSMPPIINSQYSGKVSEKTKNLFLEVTGTDLEDTKVALNILVAAIADRSGKIKSVTLDYGEEKLVTPDFTPKKMKVKFDDIENITGIKLTLKEMKDLLEGFCYNVKRAKDSLEVEYPSYRQDILHPIDVIEDILISYGYNKIEPHLPEIATVGDLDPLEVFCEDVRNLLPGFGAQEILNFTMTNIEHQFTKMNLEERDVIEIANPVSSKWSCIRSWIIPSLMEFFETNVSQEYPQQIYELGDVLILDESAETGCHTVKRLAWALADKESNFTKAKQVFDFVMKSIGLEYEIIEEDHPSFIRGRCARVKVGDRKVAYIGEIHPQVLENFNLGFPVCAFELNISEIFKLKK
ncbi:phenylalanine--tRNA ligase subunit beta [archaeon]|nr:phenylalanine--tRNA ligase subunit beta [archaeon]MBT5287948.1 phenylalanine--tRNA ligase subunit beta [archaeon]MBT7052591.1 phenylalanine--tRNA ligase subunit beta [archaeon]MBT7281265.1 phenylalanine--tRNA ligase subunit beta [archaeon]